MVRADVNVSDLIPQSVSYVTVKFLKGPPRWRWLNQDCLS